MIKLILSKFKEKIDIEMPAKVARILTVFLFKMSLIVFSFGK